jgi:hypothetical protein
MVYFRVEGAEILGSREMARYYDILNSFEENFSEPGVTTIIYCRPCGDMVTDAVCVLRREILTHRNGFSCKGCIMNIALLRQSC